MPGARAAYCDTSVLLKRYIREAGSDRAMALMHRHPVISAAIAPLEMRSALRRVESDGLISGNALQATLKRVDSERMKWDLVVVSEEILQLAEGIAVDYNVRSLSTPFTSPVRRHAKRV